MAELVRITDVAPRDGLQNEPGVVPTPQKARLVELLAGAHVDEIEVSSFVSPKWVPQLGDAAEVFALLARHPSFRERAGVARPLLSALVPNEKGMQAALAVNEHAGRNLIGKVAVFTAASETFSRKNTNATIAETIERFKPVIALAREHRLPVRGYISCVVACPFEGPVAPPAVARVAEQLLEIGCDEIDLGDTIGAAVPESIRTLLNEARRVMGDLSDPARFTLHLHDTRGTATDCTREALALGVRSFDGATGGLGGCPYASTPGQRAPGNIDTATLVRTIHAEGFRTGVDLGRLSAAAAFVQTLPLTPREREQ